MQEVMGSMIVSDFISNRPADASVIAVPERLGGLLLAAVEYSSARLGALFVNDANNIKLYASLNSNNSPLRTADASSLFVSPDQRKAVENVFRDGLIHQGSAGAQTLTSQPKSNAVGQVVCVPLKYAGEVSAALYLEAFEPHGIFTAEIIRGLSLFAAALENSMELKVIPESNDEMGQATLPRNPTRSDEQKTIIDLDAYVLHSVAEMIAAQMNDPLAAVAAHANAGLQWLRHDPPRLERAQLSLERIASATTAAADVLSNHRVQSTNLETGFAFHDISESVMNSLQVVRISKPEAIIECEISLPNSIAVFAQKRLLEHALANLIRILTDPSKMGASPRLLSISGYIEANSFVVVLSDAGTDLPSSTRDVLFDPMYTTKHDSFGVKLAIARTLILLQQGTVEIGENPNSGMTILVTLPVQQEMSGQHPIGDIETMRA